MKKQNICLSIGLGLLFIMISGFNFLADQDNNNGPKIEFNKEVHDYGKIDYKGNGKCYFVFRNTGNKPLILNKVSSSCGCTTPKWPRNAPLKPGQTDTIEVKYNTRIVGNFTKSITVFSNAVNKSPVRLKIKGKVVRNNK